MLVTIARFSFPFEAHIAKAQLESGGIPAFVADEHTINMNWLYSDALGGVRLQVQHEDVEQAKAVLAQDQSELLTEEQGYDAAVCPRCQSTNTQAFTQGKAPNFFLWIFIKLPLPIKQSIRCLDCGKVSPW